MSVSILYEDKWGRILLHKSLGIYELQWWETTVDIDQETLKTCLLRFSNFTISADGDNYLLNYSQFLGAPALAVMAEHNAQIIAADATKKPKKFAYVVNDDHIIEDEELRGAKQIDNYCSWNYFKDRRQALAWLLNP